MRAPAPTQTHTVLPLSVEGVFQHLHGHLELQAVLNPTQMYYIVSYTHIHLTASFRHVPIASFAILALWGH